MTQKNYGKPGLRRLTVDIRDAVVFRLKDLVLEAEKTGQRITLAELVQTLLQEALKARDRRKPAV